MSRVTQVAVTVGLMAVLLSACGIAAKPLVGTKHPLKFTDYHGFFDDPRTTHIKCLKQLRQPRVTLHEYRTSGGDRLPVIQVDKPHVGPTLVFYSTAGVAQGFQIAGKDEGAEAINSILLYPNKASSKVLAEVWQCTQIIN